MNDSDPSAESYKMTWPVVTGLLAFALLVRGGVLVAMFDNLRNDPDGYRNIAENLLQYGFYGPPDAHDTFAVVVPSAYRPPLYPLVLAKTAYEKHATPHVVALIHLALGMATVLLVFVLSRWWHLERWAWLATILLVCDPILLYQSTLVMTETLATFLAVVALVCLTRFSRVPTPWNTGLIGGAMALATLCRPTFLVWFAMVAVFIVGARVSWLRRIANFGMLLCVAAIVLSPWAIRNYRKFGEPLVTTTHGGYTLLLSNNPDFYAWLRNSPPGSTWDSRDFHARFDESSRDDYWTDFFAAGGRIRREFELYQDRWAYKQAVNNIRAEPAIFVYASLYRIGQLWSPLPHRLTPDESVGRRALRYATAVWYVIVFLLAIVGACSLGRQLWNAPWLWGVLLCLSFTLVHTFYWTNLRMRAPLMPVVCLLAAAGAAWLWQAVRRRKLLAGNELQTA